jgi:hypothetical protein
MSRSDLSVCLGSIAEAQGLGSGVCDRIPRPKHEASMLTMDASLGTEVKSRRLVSCVDAQFLQDVMDVRFHRGLLNCQPFGDLSIAHVLTSDQRKDLKFPFGESLDAGTRLIHRGMPRAG